MLMRRIIVTRAGRPALFRLGAIRRNLPFFLLLAVMIAGIAAGAIHGRSSDVETLKSLDVLFLTDFAAKRGEGLLSTFCASFSSAFLFMLALFVSGSSLCGCISSALIPFVKGFGYGLSVGYMYSAYGFMGILYNALIVLPGAFLSCVIITAAASQSMKCSLKMISLFRRSPVQDDPRIFMKHFLLSMLWLLLLSAVSSCIDMGASAVFSQLFNFS